MYWVRVQSQRFPLREGETTLGRSRYCTIVLDTLAASREHAAIDYTGGHLTLTDLKSRNGTAKNGVRISEPQALAAGDRITIGTEELEIVETNTIPEDVVSTVERDINLSPETSGAPLEMTPMTEELKKTR